MKAVLLPSLQEEREGDSLEVAGILPLCPPSPAVTSLVKDGKEENRGKPWSSPARMPPPDTGCEGQRCHPNNPTWALQLHEPGTWSHRLTLHQGLHTCILVETTFLSCCFQIHQLNRRILFGHWASFSSGFLGVSLFLNVWCLLLLCCPGTSGSWQKWVWAVIDVNVRAPSDHQQQRREVFYKQSPIWQLWWYTVLEGTFKQEK